MTLSVLPQSTFGPFRCGRIETGKQTERSVTPRD